MAAYTYVWEFVVAPEHVEEFERDYGPHGAWAELFRQAPGYIQTLLLRDAAQARRFVTVDRWESAEAYHGFRAQFSRQYAELDARCARLTLRETLLGTFEEAPD